MKKYFLKSVFYILILSIVVTLTACEVKYDATFTPLVMYGPTEYNEFGTPVPSGTNFPEVIIGPAPSPNRRGDPRIMSYEEVWCGDVDKICYELCFEMECGIYDVSHPRVQQFIDAVDAREDAILDWESEGRTKNISGFAAFSSCAGTLISGGGVYVTVTAADPEPVSKTILAVGGLIIAGVVCGGSIISYDHSGAEQTIDEETIDDQTMIAEIAFGYLRRYAEEESINE
jgi:hypothetical protein